MKYCLPPPEAPASFACRLSFCPRRPPALGPSLQRGLRAVWERPGTLRCDPGGTQTCPCPGVNEQKLSLGACWQFIWMGRGENLATHFPGHPLHSGHSLDTASSHCGLGRGHLPRRSCPGQAKLSWFPKAPAKASPPGDVSVAWMGSRCSAKTRGAGAPEETSAPSAFDFPSGRPCRALAAARGSSGFPQTLLAEAGSEGALPLLPTLGERAGHSAAAETWAVLEEL